MCVRSIMSYRGAQLFEAVGLSKDIVDKYFTGTVSQVGGIGLDELAEEVAIRHRVAYPNQWTATPHMNLETGGEYKWRRTGEDHLNDPEAIFLLQQSTARGDYQMFKKYSHHINDTSNRIMTLRGLMKFKHDRKPIDISEVEPASEIVKRFSTGAMSYGSISQEAHETLAIAMNSIGARSNSGRRHQRLPGARHRPADQARPGRQARRGRPPARCQGPAVDRQGPSRHPGRGAYLPAAAPRHLLHRGSEAADQRCEDGQPEGAHPRQARLGVRRRHHRGRCGQVPCRRGAYLRL